MWMHLATCQATGPRDKKRYMHGRKAVANWLTRAQMAEARTLAHVWADAFKQRRMKHDLLASRRHSHVGAAVHGDALRPVAGVLPRRGGTARSLERAVPPRLGRTPATGRRASP